jgi:hypothetical protein
VTVGSRVTTNMRVLPPSGCVVWRLQAWSTLPGGRIQGKPPVDSLDRNIVRCVALFAAARFAWKVIKIDDLPAPRSASRATRFSTPRPDSWSATAPEPSLLSIGLSRSASGRKDARSVRPNGTRIIGPLLCGVVPFYSDEAGGSRANPPHSTPALLTSTEASFSEGLSFQLSYVQGSGMRVPR